MQTYAMRAFSVVTRLAAAAVAMDAANRMFRRPARLSSLRVHIISYQQPLITICSMRRSEGTHPGFGRQGWYAHWPNLQTCDAEGDYQGTMDTHAPREILT